MLEIIKLHFGLSLADVLVCKNDRKRIGVCENVSFCISKNHYMAHFYSELKHPYIVFLTSVSEWP